MDFDQLLVRFFGTQDIDTLAPDALVAGLNRLRLQFSMEKDAEQRFGYWCLLYMLGAAPEIEDAFASEDDREAAREFAEELDAEMDEDEG
jgi:hypothetical protein